MTSLFSEMQWLSCLCLLSFVCYINCRLLSEKSTVVQSQRSLIALRQKNSYRKNASEKFLRGWDNMRWKPRISFPSCSMVYMAEPLLTYRLCITSFHSHISHIFITEGCFSDFGYASILDANRLNGACRIEYQFSNKCHLHDIGGAYHFPEFQVLSR